MFVALLALTLAAQDYGDYGEPESCKIIWAGPKDEWRFVKIYEQSTGVVVFQSVLNGGETRGIYVKTPRIRVESKWAGDRNYHAGPAADCKGGNTVRI